MELKLIELLLAAIGSVISMQFMGMRKDLSKISDSVENLNIKISQIVTNQDWHKEEIIQIKNRLNALENGE
jgi:hypothetical protein